MNALRLTAPTLLAICIIVVVIAGEAIVFTSNHSDYSSDIAAEGGSIGYVINGKGTHEYDAISLSGGLDRPKAVAVYYDPAYASDYEKVSVAVGGRALDQQYYVQQMGPTLQLRDIGNVVVCDAAGLKDFISANGKDSAVICLSGALPDTVYDGTSGSPIIEWVSAGGRLYWAGNVIGAEISTKGGLVPVKDGTSLFLGTECVDASDAKAYGSVKGDGLSDALSLLNNDLRYGVVTGSLPSDRQHLELGYTDGERSSISIVGLGDGMVCIVAGDYSNFQRIDLAQIVASGISPSTELVDAEHGKVSGTVRGSLEAGDHVYICIGGDFAVFGKLHGVGSE